VDVLVVTCIAAVLRIIATLLVGLTLLVWWSNVLSFEWSKPFLVIGSTLLHWLDHTGVPFLDLRIALARN